MYFKVYYLSFILSGMYVFVFITTKMQIPLKRYNMLNFICKLGF
jgi:hypothetical protein